MIWGAWRKKRRKRGLSDHNEKKVSDEPKKGNVNRPRRRMIRIDWGEINESLEKVSYELRKLRMIRLADNEVNEPLREVNKEVRKMKRMIRIE